MSLIVEAKKRTHDKQDWRTRAIELNRKLGDALAFGQAETAARLSIELTGVLTMQNALDYARRA